MKTYSRVIMMGDPSEFRIKRGANPHTRNRWGFKKHVDRVKAREQWLAMVETLSSYDVRVQVVPPHEDYPGLVFPANAGFVPRADEAMKPSERSIILSNLNPARAGEEGIYQEFLKRLGLSVHRIHAAFEGEADLIRWGEDYIFTYGSQCQAAWAPHLGLPPWKRCYGFRSVHHAIHELAHWVSPEHVMAVQLIDERYYHGDTLFCSFGPDRRYLMVYEKAMAPLAGHRFHDNDAVIFLSDDDAAAFAANSFPMSHQGQELLFMPAGVSAELVRRIETLDVQVVTIDVSEFLEKGGGSVKCMIGDLGIWTAQ